jgi:hypothetical protein
MIKIIQIRSKWMWRLLLFVVGLLVWMIWRVESPISLNNPVVPVEPQLNSADTVLAVANTPHGPIALNRAVMCLDVHESRPLLIKSIFDRRVDYLFCYSVLTAAKGPVTVVHRWKNNQRVIFEKRMTVYGKRVRAWSKRQLYMKQSGEWSVEIITEGGIVLGSVYFTLL